MIGARGPGRRGLGENDGIGIGIGFNPGRDRVRTARIEVHILAVGQLHPIIDTVEDTGSRSASGRGTLGVATTVEPGAVMRAGDALVIDLVLEVEDEGRIGKPGRQAAPSKLGDLSRR